MDSLLNRERPPVYCPGCAHEQITRALDKAFQNMGLKGNRIALVSDIGCSGLFDTFFHTHAFHGLHGRVLTYATGIKLARPELKVIATLGDGGLGIGGAHLLSACRRNLDLTLIVLNNFNYGMTGGQCSSTTPQEARVGSGFLNQLEYPLDPCRVAVTAGATYATRCSAYVKDLPRIMEEAIEHQGFSILDIWGICPGRYTRQNKLTPQIIDRMLDERPPFRGEVQENKRKEYGAHYRKVAGKLPSQEPPSRLEARFEPPDRKKQQIIMLGGAGQRVITAGELLCLAGITGGLHATQKNEYNITVLRGPSISEVILSPDEVGFTGIDKPMVILALDEEGVARRRWLFDRLEVEAMVLQATGVEIPSSIAQVYAVDFKAQNIKKQDWSLAGLAALAKLNKCISMDMLRSALAIRFRGPVLETASELVDRVEIHEYSAE